MRCLWGFKFPLSNLCSNGVTVDTYRGNVEETQRETCQWLGLLGRALGRGKGKKTRSAIICELDLSGEKDSRDGDWAIGRRRVIERPEAGKQPKGYE